MLTNISTPISPAEQVARFLFLISQPARIQILTIMSQQEACVCHLEAVMGMRQASISQHLMVLRKAGLVIPRRDGRNIFYHLAHPEVIEILERAVPLAGCDPEELQPLLQRPVPGCTCPLCCPDADPKLACKGSHAGSKPPLAGMPSAFQK